MIAVAFNPKTLAPAWNALQSAMPVRLAAIHTQAEYDGAVAFMTSFSMWWVTMKSMSWPTCWSCWGNWSKTTIRPTMFCQTLTPVRCCAF